MGGRIAAAALGGTVLSFAIGVFFSVFYPGFDGLDQAFVGGLMLVFVWPLITLWVLFAGGTRAAWTRVLVPSVLLIILNMLGLML